MVSVLRECISMPEMDTIRIATGYWDIPGTALVVDELQSFLDREGTKLKLLIGKDPYVYAKMLKEPKFMNKSYPDEFIRTNIDDLADNLRDEHKQVINLLLKFCEKGCVKNGSRNKESLAEELDSKIEIRILKKDEDEECQFMHSKCYIFTSNDDDEKPMHAIVGSSNFTKKGLEGNAELNVLENDPYMINAPIKPTRKGHITWFEEKWEQAEDWTQEFLEQILKTSKPVQQIQEEEEQKELSAPLTSYELYIKYLQMHFGDIADATNRAILDSYLPKGYTSINYQMDAVEQCFQILRIYGGFFLSDVVGLGKTVVGLLIIKKFIAEASNYNREPKVLIIVPPAIKPAWEETISKFDEDNEFKIYDKITIITTGSIDSLNENIPEEVEDDDIQDIAFDNYGMIIIDESHNFRNNETRKYKALETLIYNITMKGEQPFIGLLSATPQNNSPEDLKNQIYLFELEPNRSRFTNVEGGKLDSFFAEKQREFMALRNEDSDEAREQLKVISREIREKVLDHIVVRRTRTDIRKHYQSDAQNLKFPVISGPKRLSYTMDSRLAQLFADTMTAILPKTKDEQDGVKHIGYYRYQAINFFTNDENKKLYEKRNLTVEGISKRLAKIMQVLLVKRLESSFAAFTESLNNLLQYTRNMIAMIENDMVFICPDLDVNKEFEDFNYDFIKATISIEKKAKERGGKNRCFRSNDFKESYLKSLREDELLIMDLCSRWEKNKFDPKMNAFVAELQSTLFNHAINNPQEKDKPRLVIFTEAKATQEEIARVAENFGHRVLKIDAANRKDMEKVIKENFDALSDVKKDDYDIIVTTEVLAEGVNLHRANVILNYDTPWNATRLMQRIGRVNRIGSQEDFVHVFNFYPSVQGNEYIKLVQKAYAKLQAFHTMFGEDNKIYSELEEVSEAEFNHNFEGEESPFSQFFTDLKEYKRDNPERYEYIKSLEFENLGGQFVNSDGIHRFIIKTGKRAGTPIVINNEGVATIVSPLGFMESLKAASSMTFADSVDKSLYDNYRNKALKAYNLHTTHVINKSDSNHRIEEAKQLIMQINDRLTSKEARKALKAARKAVDNGNSQVIKLVKKCADEYLNNRQKSLFTEQDNIDIYVQSMFSQIASKAKQQYGEPYVGMYEL